ncbi:Zinc finger, GATA-type [Artemisia annua]|uniref:Zinc finger, GATA-type n=1 Tax=Artemisia annua TaxID=35608 RepID=A0A2U1MP44_ARTAN|nr:Zinc finger, GATA-type [Artemisia annua]
MDLQDKRSSGESEEEMNESSGDSRSCRDCKTTSTPLWRGGPDGPKTLCNACGIKYNKKRRAQLRGLDQNGKRIAKSAVKPNSDLKLNVRLMVHNQNKKPQQQRQQEKLQQQRQQVKLQQQRQREALQQQQQREQEQEQQQQQQPRKRSTYERGKPWWNKLGEEEQAAILLMSISCGGSNH